MTQNDDRTRLQRLLEEAMDRSADRRDFLMNNLEPSLHDEALRLLHDAETEQPQISFEPLASLLDDALNDAEDRSAEMDLVTLGEELTELDIVPAESWAKVLADLAPCRDIEAVLDRLVQARRHSVLEGEVEILTDYQAREILAGRARDLRIGKFVLRREIPGGRGGFGRVFRARESGLDRLVAVKVLSLQSEVEAQTDVEQSFQEEAKLMAKLAESVPCLPRVWAHGESNGRHYIAMEFIDGRTLETVMRDTMHRGERIPVSSALVWVAAVAETLVQAHSKRLIHCDVKPSNIMLDRAGNPRLLDLGVARLLRTQDELDGAAVSKPVLGTRNYVAPESSNQRALSPAADVFSLGCTLYFLLYGNPPPPQPECAKRPPPVRSDVPYEVRALIDRMVAGSPDSRPDAKHVAVEIRRMQESVCGTFRAADLVTLQEWPHEFRVSCAVVGDRREHPPLSLADVLALPASSGDLFYLGRLRMDALIRSDKTISIENDDTQREVLRGDLLVVGSPAANLCARRVNDFAAFRFAVRPEARRLTESLIQALKPLEPWGARFRGALDPDDANNRQRLRDLHHLHNEYSKSGFIDPVNYKALRGTTTKAHLDYGIVSLCRNPWDENGIVVFAAGIHGPGTAAAVRMLMDGHSFDLRPLGGVFKVEISQLQPWSRRYEFLEPKWDTDPYTVIDYELAVQELAKRTASGEVPAWEGLDERAAKDAADLLELLRRRHARGSGGTSRA